MPPKVTLADIQIANSFIDALKTARLEDEQEALTPEVYARLRNPLQEPIVIDADLRYALGTYIHEEASEKKYAESMGNYTRRHPEVPTLSFHSLEKKIQDITGVVPIETHMCPDTCVAFTGPYRDLHNCPKCGKARYQFDQDGETKIPERVFHTIPIGPQIQSIWRTPEGVHDIGYRERRTEEIMAELGINNDELSVYDDVYCGEAYLNAYQAGKIKPGDPLLMYSIDGAQLYRSKHSDCWIYIWVLLDYDPVTRYKKKHVLVGGIIPGPNKPKDLDSFLFPGLHHVVCLMKEGLPVWDCVANTVKVCKPFLFLITADGPAMAYLDGLCGHCGAYGCRLYCPVKGRRYPGDSHYYPALLLPLFYDVEGCNHPDVVVDYLPSGNTVEYLAALSIVVTADNASYETRRRETGIARPSIFSGFPSDHILDLPGCFPADLMHLISINIPELLLKLWRGQFKCHSTDDKATWDWVCLTGEVWKLHGKQVEELLKFLPNSFDRPPRNPEEKLSSGYKAWEFLTYIYGYGPALFHGILPEKYWVHFCKLVRGVRLIHQRKATPEELLEAHQLLIQFVLEFEELYYQRKACRLHFCRQSIHALLHLVPEIIRLGPGAYYTQWTMERTIGNLGEEIKQHSNPYANLSQRAIRRAQINTLTRLIPDLVPEKPLPSSSHSLDGGYVLLGGKDEFKFCPEDKERTVILAYLEDAAGEQVDPGWGLGIIRWARLRLPNLQIVRAWWKEKHLRRVPRMGRNIMVCLSLSLNYTTINRSNSFPWTRPSTSTQRSNISFDLSAPVMRP